MSSRIQVRRGTAAAWNIANPVLLAGEPGYETDTGKEKRGDGVTAWTSLRYPFAAAFASTYLTPSGGDDSVAMASALAAGGLIVLGPGTFLWNTSVPAFKRSTPTRVVGAGISETIIKLSSGAPRAFDFNKVANDDTFNDIEISDLTVDANSTTGQHHVVIGNYVSGGQSTRINVARLTVRRVRTINVPTDPTVVTNRIGIFLSPVVNISTDNPCSLTDVTLEDLDFLQGGNSGVSIGGTKTDGNAISNVSWDRIYLTRVKHDTGQVNNSTTYSSVNIQIGSKDTGGTTIIRDCYGANSGDLGIGVLNARYGLVEGSMAVDAPNGGFQAQGFAAAPAGQVVTFRDCHAKVVNLQPSATGHSGAGFTISGAGNVNLGDVIFDGCSFQSAYAQFSAPAQAFGGTLAASVAKLTIRDFAIDIPSIVDTGGVGNFPTLVVIALSGNSAVKIENLRCSIAGSTTNTTMQAQLVGIGANASGDLHVDIDGVTIDNRLTGTQAAFYGLQLAKGNTAGGIRGRARGVEAAAGWTGANPTAVLYVYATAAGNTANNLLIEDCDFSELPGGTDLNVNQINVFSKGITYRVAPAPSNITGLVTATGKTSGKTYPGVWTFKQGTGAAITAIDYSTDGGTTYTNFLTQASAALPAGFDQSLGPLPADALVKVTFTTTQPTITLVPSAP